MKSYYPKRGQRNSLPGKQYIIARGEMGRDAACRFLKDEGGVSVGAGGMLACTVKPPLDWSEKGELRKAAGLVTIFYSPRFSRSFTISLTSSTGSSSSLAMACSGARSAAR